MEINKRLVRKLSLSSIGVEETVTVHKHIISSTIHDAEAHLMMDYSCGKLMLP